MSLPTIYISSPLCYLPLLAPDITLSTLLSDSPQYIVLHPCVTFHFGPRYHSQHHIISIPTIYSSSHLCYLPLFAPDITLSTLLSVSPKYTVLHPSVTFRFGPRYHSQHAIISLPTIYISSPLCYLPLLAPDITLSTLLSVFPQYKLLHPSVTFPLWPQISLSAPYY